MRREVRTRIRVWDVVIVGTRYAQRQTGTVCNVADNVLGVPAILGAVAGL